MSKEQRTRWHTGNRMPPFSKPNETMKKKAVIIAAIIGGLALTVFLLGTTLDSVACTITGWWTDIEDPTERGCAYIATAVAAHALIVAMKNFSTKP
jgi:hypothetical protein